MSHIFHYPHRFPLESGGSLPELTIAYDVFGEPNARGDNYVWVCHALTANSDVADWWPHTLDCGRFIDSGRYCVVCANILASCYGTTGPLSEDPTTRQPWYDRFPPVTVRDIVAAHRLLARHLGISRVQMLVGSSIGGFQCVEWAVQEPAFARHLVLIATGAKASPWVTALNASQRMAIETDATWGQPSPQAALQGMGTARSIALLSYRGGKAYCKTQAEPPDETALFDRRADSYQRYQGQKLQRRFNAYSYYRLTQAIDSHDVGRGRGGVEAALGRICSKTLVVAITSDILFPPDEHQQLAAMIPGARMATITSDFGHDGFLVEHDQLNDIIQQFINS